MSLKTLEHIINFSFKSDILNPEKALGMIGAEIDESIMENIYGLANLPFFTPEIINGEVKLIEVEHFTIETKNLQDFMEMLLMPESSLYDGFVSCLNDVIRNNKSKYHYLTSDDSEWDGIYAPLVIYYHLLKNHGSDSPLFKLFKLFFNKDYHYILDQSAQNKMDVINFVEWILDDKNHYLYQALFVENSPNGKNENVSVSIYIQGGINEKMTHKIDVGVHIYLEPFLFYDKTKKTVINLLHTQTGDVDLFCALETSIRLSEIKANRMYHKYTHYRYAIDFSDFDSGPFKISPDETSFFNFSPTLCCSINANDSENKDEDDDEQPKFVTEYDYDRFVFDDMDLLNMLLKSSPIDNVFDIEVI